MLTRLGLLWLQLTEALVANETFEVWCVSRGWPHPRGLLVGLMSVLLGQIVILIYYVLMRFVVRPRTMQYRLPPGTTLKEDLWAHIAAPESFLMTFGYLAVTWMFGLNPASYYDYAAPLNWLHVLAQFLCVDFFIYVAHRLEHAFPDYYQRSHKFHHLFRQPKIYNAFNGSIADTLTLILIPLFITLQLCRFVSHTSFVAFGTLYASQFTLIHSEFEHPWEVLFRLLGVGTAWDHQVHHALFIYNYGHFFMYWDRLFGTFKDAASAREMRLSGLQDLDLKLSADETARESIKAD